MIFKDKTILVTGGTGSMGSTAVRRVLGNELGTPKKVIVFSRDEAKQHEMRMSYQHRRAATDEVIFRNFMNVLEFRIGDVRSYADVCSAVREADIVINAAALKQVADLRILPRAGDPHQLPRRREHRPRDPGKPVPGADRDRHLDRQGLQAGQRHGDDEIAAGAHLHSPPTSSIRRRASSACATATCSPRAAR
jgi:NAD(P)-dependent dehydrogenase (short-subunit alcohol dehydrogenase family)